MPSSSVNPGLRLLLDDFTRVSSQIQLIWGKKWDAIRITFTLDRYVTLMGAAMTTYAAVTDRSEFKSCATFGNVSYGKQR
ncbi:hypothetical protein BDR03DRAFT_1012579 [Suillus americanus]|nr:hypothetical protein BDR03DRAFT_1012579 [Suillus americanus]